MNKPVIEVINVTKTFSVSDTRARDLKTWVIQLFSRNKIPIVKSEKVILKNVSFNIYPGEFVGIMGRNGVGKSTILKIISGIYSPNDGEVRVSGIIAPVLELGAGFSDELSGFENIFLNASILGFSKKKVHEVLPSIIDFSELGDSIHLSVRNYSSGMLVRLAFSIACHLDAPILLFDEILAVGDLGFQKKCLDKIDELYKSGRAIILVTHSPDQVKDHCNRCIVFDNSSIVFDGDTTLGTEVYRGEFNL